MNKVRVAAVMVDSIQKARRCAFSGDVGGTIHNSRIFVAAYGDYLTYASGRKPLEPKFASKRYATLDSGARNVFSIGVEQGKTTEYSLAALISKFDTKMEKFHGMVKQNLGTFDLIRENEIAKAHAVLVQELMSLAGNILGKKIAETRGDEPSEAVIEARYHDLPESRADGVITERDWMVHPDVPYDKPDTKDDLLGGSGGSPYSRRPSTFESHDLGKTKGFSV